MKVFTLILEKPLRVKNYTSLTALFEDNGAKVLGCGKSKLEHHDWNYNYVDYGVTIAKTETQTTGDVRKKKRVQTE